ncbi:unnamed protein product, partial [Iphiclides podalirius]
MLENAYIRESRVPLGGFAAAWAADLGGRWGVGDPSRHRQSRRVRRAWWTSPQRHAPAFAKVRDRERAALRSVSVFMWGDDNRGMHE